ncbi:fimbrial protein [Vibrio owensii]|uniref:fimbrial protein n=1 Tax=Vibrio owensii TaxID=696485 RepID=UPI003AAEF908
MKAFTLTALAALAMASATGASANTGTIKFSGAITSSTCDINLTVDGIVSPTGVAELGTYDASAASTVGVFGTPVALSLVPDLATCTSSPAGLGAQVSVVSPQVDDANTSVITNADTATTNVGVLLTLESGTPVVNQGNIALTSGSTDLDATTAAINFTAQPYATEATIAAGLIGGTASYTVSYL